MSRRSPWFGCSIVSSLEGFLTATPESYFARRVGMKAALDATKPTFWYREKVTRTHALTQFSSITKTQPYIHFSAIMPSSRVHMKSRYQLSRRASPRTDLAAQRADFLACVFGSRFPREMLFEWLDRSCVVHVFASFDRFITPNDVGWLMRGLACQGDQFRGLGLGCLAGCAVRFIIMTSLDFPTPREGHLHSVFFDLNCDVYMYWTSR